MAYRPLSIGGQVADLGAPEDILAQSINAGAARDALRRAALDAKKAQLDLAKQTIENHEQARTVKEDAGRRDVLGGYIRNREGAQDLPIGIQSPEFMDAGRPSNAPFGPMNAPAPKPNRMERNAILDLAAVNPDFAENFRKGQIGERQGIEDRTRKINSEDQSQIDAAAEFARKKNKDANDLALNTRQQKETERNNRAQNNVAWFMANTGRQKAAGTANGKPLPSNRVVELADQQSALKQMDTMYPEALAFSKKAGANAPLFNRLAAKNPWNSEAQGIKQYIAATKQVIGKSLEGGVLRKEDEAKYEKIIPNIGDTPETLDLKNKQLRALISNRRTEQLKELKQAGYNVGDFEPSLTAPEEYNPDEWEVVQ